MEKYLTVESAKIVGTSQEGVWIQAYSFEPPLPEQKATRGDLYCVIDISSPVDFDVASTGKLVLQRLEREYYGNVKTGILASLEEALKEAYKELEETITTTEEKRVFEFNITLAVVWGMVIYFAKIGDGKVYLWREGKLRQLLPGVEQIGEKEELGVETISGPMQNRDVFIMGSPQFYHLVSTEVITGQLDHQPIRDVADNFAPILYQADNSGASCAILLGVSEEDVPSAEEEGIAFVDTSVVEEGKEEELPKEVILPTKETKVLQQRALFGGLRKKIVGILLLLPILLQKIVALIPRFGAGTSTIHLRDDDGRRSKKTTFFIAVLVLLILVAVVFMGTNRRQNEKKREQFQSIYSDAKTKFEQGKDLTDINLKIARPQLLEAKQKLEEAKKLHFDDKKVDELLKEVNEQLRLVSREFTVSNPTAFLDFSLIKQGAVATRISLYENRLGILDTKNSVVYGVDLKSKSQSILGGGASNITNSASFISLYGDFVYVFSTEKGIIQIDTKNSKTKVVIEKDSSWGDIAEMVVYSSNIYLLDKGKNQIWKYQSAEGGFSNKIGWFAVDTVIDLSKTSTMAIDGPVWTVTKDGDILKYLRGAKDSFNVTGVDQSLSSPSIIFTNNDIENLYVLDRSQKRVMVVSKEDGSYQAQYSGDVFGQSVGLVADEKNKVLYIVNSDRIYSTELK